MGTTISGKRRLRFRCLIRTVFGGHLCAGSKAQVARTLKGQVLASPRMAGATQYVYWRVPPGDLRAGELIQVPCMIRGGMHTVSVPDGAEEGEECHTVEVTAPVSPKTKPHSILRFAAGAPTTLARNVEQPPEGQVEAGAAGLDTAQFPWRRRANCDAPGKVAFDSGKQPGDDVTVCCCYCSTQNTTEMTANPRAKFECAHCGRRVVWRPRQVWLRDQGRPLEMSIHPQPGEEREERRKADMALMKDIVTLNFFTKCLSRPQSQRVV